MRACLRGDELLGRGGLGSRRAYTKVWKWSVSGIVGRQATTMSQELRTPGSAVGTDDDQKFWKRKLTLPAKPGVWLMTCLLL